MVGEAPPCSLEAFKRFRAQSSEGSEGVYMFHSHNYFNPDLPGEVEIGRQFYRELQARFKDNEDVEVHGFYERPAGPHTWGNFEVLFTRKAFTDVITWSMLNRPESMSILCHPFASMRQADDHSRNALWLGNQIPVKLEIIKLYDDVVAKEFTQMPFEDVMWLQAVHRGHEEPPDPIMLRVMEKAKAMASSRH